MSTALAKTSLRECPGIIKTMHTGFSAYTYCIMPTAPGADLETGRYDLAWKIYSAVFF